MCDGFEFLKHSFSIGLVLVEYWCWFYSLPGKIRLQVGSARSRSKAPINGEETPLPLKSLGRPSVSFLQDGSGTAPHRIAGGSTAWITCITRRSSQNPRHWTDATLEREHLEEQPGFGPPTWF